MLRSIFSAIAICLLIASCGPTGSQSGTGQISPGDSDAIRLSHVDAVNAVRIQSGLTPVQISAELNAAAETHARDMSVQNRAWHFGSDLTSPRERAFRAGYRGELIGENISEGADTDLIVLGTWLDFKDTRGVIVHPDARGLGLGWYRDATGKTWWVQVIGE